MMSICASLFSYGVYVVYNHVAPCSPMAVAAGFIYAAQRQLHTLNTSTLRVGNPVTVASFLLHLVCLWRALGVQGSRGYRRGRRL